MRPTRLAVVVLALLAGCTAAAPGPAPAPAPSDGDPVQYNVTNLESTAASVEVGVVDGPVETLELRSADGTGRSVAPPYVGEPTEIRSAIVSPEADSVAVAGLETRLSVEIGPRESATGEIAVPGRGTVVVIASVDGTVRAVGLLRCGENDRMNQVAFVVGGYGPLVGGGCGGA